MRKTIREKKGKVYLIGAGPGDPELMTLKGLRLLKAADAVLYDHLIPKVLLKKVRRGAELISVGKKHSQHSLSQDAIQELLLQKARAGKRVVRLKGGDPYVFGRGGEEAIFLKRRGIETEVVPGVSSAIAVPAMAGIPVTQRHLAMTVAFASGHVTRDNDPIPVPDADTLVYLMSVFDLEKTVKCVLEKRKPATPCALIENGTTSQERVIVGSLGDIVRKARKVRVRPPAVFVVGNVVDLRDKIFPEGKK